MSVSPARLAANRANAQLSTGPRTEAGKAASSKNAVKTGLTVLLPSEDAEAYETDLLQYLEEFAPIVARETQNPCCREWLRIYNSARRPESCETEPRPSGSGIPLNHLADSDHPHPLVQ